MKTYLTFKQAKEKFLEGFEVWHETSDTDKNGDILSTTKSLDYGDTLEYLDEDFIYFEI